jgi:hypothetical protein
MSLFGVAVVGVSALVASALYLALYLRWERRQTGGIAYFRRSEAERLALKRRIGWYSLPAKPLIYLLALLNRKRSTMPAFEYAGVCGPPKVSSAQVFERATKYVPQPQDVFVATQMRSGTTWMQQLVYQIVTRGYGDLDTPGRSHLYAISPWIDAIDSVSLADAPLVGEPPVRIIKTHLPATLCPYARHAKYIYVARHPVRCFASIVDFNRTLLGPLVPSVTTLADWFCSDRMYWLPWPRHVDGWWRWAEQRDNVLFVHYEATERDFGSVRDAVAGFLGYALTADEKRRVDERCSFGYMKAHETSFEMAPPTMFSVNGGKFMMGGARGEESRDADIPPVVRERILAYCREALFGSAYPAARFYPDLAVSAPLQPIAAPRAAGGAA